MERTPLPTYSQNFRVARGLAESFVAGPWRDGDLIGRGEAAIGRRPRWLSPLVRRLLERFPGCRPTAAAVVSFLDTDGPFQRACARPGRKIPVVLAYGRQPPPAMWPAPGPPSAWTVPTITTPGQLAEFLGLEPGELDWFADCQGRARRGAEGPLHHYRYSWRRKASGEARLIEAPKPRLRAVQRRLLDEVLDRVPPHEAAHGFRTGRSVRTFATPHSSRRVVLAMDLRDFFPTVTAARVVAFFLTAGYPEPVARRLADVCTSRVPTAVLSDPACPAGGPASWRTRRMFAEPHLPQGAPTSPALANLCAYRLDLRLASLAGAAEARYTRYADDLVFSGGEDFERSLPRFVVRVGAIALEEGFAVNTRKTRVMRRGVRQRVAGVVVNDRPNVARDDHDRLKAILHNCTKLGPGGQNREGHPDFRAHLAGRIAHVAMLSPTRGDKLRVAFDAVEWRPASGDVTEGR